jgi:hypothetical protein
LNSERPFLFSNPRYDLYEKYFGHEAPSSIKQIYSMKSDLATGLHNQDYLWVQYFIPLEESALKSSLTYNYDYFCFGVDEDGQSLLLKVKDGQSDDSIYIDFDLSSGNTTDVEKTELQISTLLQALKNNG